MHQSIIWITLMMALGGCKVQHEKPRSTLTNESFQTKVALDQDEFLELSNFTSWQSASLYCMKGNQSVPILEHRQAKLTEDSLLMIFDPIGEALLGKSCYVDINGAIRKGIPVVRKPIASDANHKVLFTSKAQTVTKDGLSLAWIKTYEIVYPEKTPLSLDIKPSPQVLAEFPSLTLYSTLKLTCGSLKGQISRAGFKFTNTSSKWDFLLISAIPEGTPCRLEARTREGVYLGKNGLSISSLSSPILLEEFPYPGVQEVPILEAITNLNGKLLGKTFEMTLWRYKSQRFTPQEAASQNSGTTLKVTAINLETMEINLEFSNPPRPGVFAPPNTALKIESGFKDAKQNYGITFSKGYLLLEAGEPPEIWFRNGVLNQGNLEGHQDWVFKEVGPS